MINFKGSCYKPFRMVLSSTWSDLPNFGKKENIVIIYTHKILPSCPSTRALHTYQVLARILQSLAADDGERSMVEGLDQDWVSTRGSGCRSVLWCCSDCREETCMFLHRNLPHSSLVARCNRSSPALRMKSREGYGEKGGREMIMDWLITLVV